jgi:integrase/recombinase XerD
MCTSRDNFIEWLRSWGASPSTIVVRMRVVAAFCRECDALTASAEDIARWLARPGLSPWTRHSYYGHLRSLYDWLRRTGRRPDDPMLDMRAPKRPAQKPRPLDPLEQSRALVAADDTVRAFLLLGLFAGLRAFEIAKIRGEDVTADALYVRGKGGKDAMIPTHPTLWDLAQAMPRIGWWFPSPHADKDHIHPATVTRRITALFAELGIEGSTHRARHSYCTNLMRAGVALRIVQELARHESLATTAGYLAVDEDERRAAIGLLSA